MKRNKKSFSIILIICCFIFITLGLILKKYVFVKKIMQERVEVINIILPASEIKICFYPRC